MGKKVKYLITRYLLSHDSISIAGADLGFSLEGRSSKNVDLFFLSTKKTLFWPNFLRRRKIIKSGQKNRFWALFGKDVFGHFLARAPPES